MEPIDNCDFFYRNNAIKSGAEKVNNHMTRITTQAGENDLYLGIDLGAIAVKAALYTRSMPPLTLTGYTPLLQHSYPGHLYLRRYERVHGAPAQALAEIFQELTKAHLADRIANLVLTGGRSCELATSLGVHYLNDFKAIAFGVGHLNPAVHTILEIGGDTSKYLHLDVTEAAHEAHILDYGVNGDCAAGTGSFIDQQASRMRYPVEELGELVLCARCAARIAGRCSVFAKTDMIHAQQRGYEPAAIFKGLCEAVIRNFRGTVLRGKKLTPVVAFVGGLAQNAGVVAAMHTILELDSDLWVPDFPAHYGAIGAAISGPSLPARKLHPDRLHSVSTASRAPVLAPLDLSRVVFLRDRFERQRADDLQVQSAFLGIDVGSVSTNLVVLDPDGQVQHEIYTSTEGRPVAVVCRALQEIGADRFKILAVGCTGSGRELAGELVGADVIHDEITAHKTGALFVAEKLLASDVDTIFEIGGQDSKFIALDHGVVVDFAMNEACAAGTGSFLEEQAERMQISIINEFAQLALAAERPLQLGERCTVFMEKDVINFLQQGASKTDIAAGLAYSIVHNYLNRVVRGRKIGDQIFFQGGTAYNDAVAAAFATVLKKRIIVPPHNGVIGAIGAALLAMKKYRQRAFTTRFRGFTIDASSYSVKNFTCKACSNECEIQEFKIDNEKSYWGDRCSDRFRKPRILSRKAVIPDLFELRETLLIRDIPGPDGLGIKIGIPRILYFFDRFPFWRSYFSALGAEIVLSERTNRKIVNTGQETCVAEPCFPIIVSHGHVADLIEKNVDYLFLPNVIDAETDAPGQQSWLCPWGQTFPYIVRSAPAFDKWRQRILAPHIRFRESIPALKQALHDLARTLGVSTQKSDRAVEAAVKMQLQFQENWQMAGSQARQQIADGRLEAVVIIGRPYNVFDAQVNLDLPAKLRKLYGINVLPMDCLPLTGIPVTDIHSNMFWNYGRKILQAGKFIQKHDNLHAIYFTNFKCGPDSYIKHFISDALGKPYLILQFDGHSNDAGILTRAEAFLQSKGLLDEVVEPQPTVLEIF